MAYSGKIYIKDHNGEAVGLGQSFEILPHDGGYAGFLATSNGNEQFSSVYNTEEACLAAIKGGGGIIIIDDSDF